MKRTFLFEANTEAKVRKIADWYGWQAEEDSEGQIIIYTNINESTPQVAQEAAAIYGWDYDSENNGSIVLFTGVFSSEQCDS
jgi:hypothetical protein